MALHAASRSRRLLLLVVFMAAGSGRGARVSRARAGLALAGALPVGRVAIPTLPQERLMRDTSIRPFGCPLRRLVDGISPDRARSLRRERMAVTHSTARDGGWISNVAYDAGTVRCAVQQAAHNLRSDSTLTDAANRAQDARAQGGMRRTTRFCRRVNANLGVLV